MTLTKAIYITHITKKAIRIAPYVGYREHTIMLVFKSHALKFGDSTENSTYGVKNKK